jgi:hypothetical protein
MSPDPFATLRDELRAAEQRLAAPAAVAPRRLRGRRPLLVAIAVLALGGTATAAVVSLTGGTPSAPLRGDTPPGTGIKHYSISLRPNLGAGEAGWCWTLSIGGGAALGCGPAPAPGAAQVAGGDLMLGRPGKAAAWRGIAFRILAPRVAAVRLQNGERIVPRPDRALPFGWTAAVMFTRYRGKMRPASYALLDAADHVIGTSGPSTDRTAAPGVAALPTVSVNPRTPPDRPCAIHHRALPHLSARDQKVVGVPVRRGAAPVLGRAFRTCAAATFYLRDHRVTAAVLTDVAGPGVAPADLPHRSPNMNARRIGNAWLVAYGPDPASRRAVLGALTVVRPR